MNSYVPVKVNFNSNLLTLILILDKNFADFEAKRDLADKLELSEKPEIHFTVIGSETGEALINLCKDFNSEEKTTFVKKILNLSTLLNRP